MAEEDVYGNKRRYESFLARLEEFLVPATEVEGVGRRRYHCRNAANLQYFKRLHYQFEARDVSYIRRNRVFDTLRFITFATEKDLRNCERDDIDEIAALGHKTNVTPDSKKTFIQNIRHIWTSLFPELDAQGRILDNVRPYPVRHLSGRVDPSKERREDDRLTVDELARLLSYFSNDPRVQANMTLILESMGRPQEVSYTRIGDIEDFETYAKVWVSSHGKEGTKFLACINSYPYLLKCLAQHPYANDLEAFIFTACGRRDRQLTPCNLRKKLKKACQHLGIKKNITPYSLKRNGVTFRILSGESRTQVAHLGNWASEKSVDRYNLSTADDALRAQLEKQGLAPPLDLAGRLARRLCACGALVGFAEKICPTCKRSTDPEKIRADAEADLEIREVFSLAMKQPDRTFAQVLEEYRRGRLAGASR